jgi:predicted Zn-ribbon and HTH transcriptional regulator
VNCCREGQNLKFRVFLSARKALCEHLDCVRKLSRYSGSRKIAEKRDCNNCGFGTIRFEIG